MATSNPIRPEDEISEREKEILRERLKTIEEDAKDAVNAREAIKEMRRSLKQQPRSPR
jgi:hypothetical protein